MDVPTEVPTDGPVRMFTTSWSSCRIDTVIVACGDGARTFRHDTGVARTVDVAGSGVAAAMRAPVVVVLVVVPSYSAGGI
jgi:hypothetical protein